jgi:ABC-2 type transport system permease protein
MAMRKVLVIAVREYLAAVKSKAFIIGLIMMPVLMSGGAIAQFLLGDQVDLTPKRFAIVDRTPGQRFAALLQREAKKRNEAADAHKKPAFVIVDEPVTDETDWHALRFRLSDRVRAGELTGFLEIAPDIVLGGPDTAALRYQSNRPSYQDFAHWANQQINQEVLAQRAAQRPVNLADLGSIVRPVPLVTKGLTTRDARTGELREGDDQNPIVALLLPGGMLVLMFMLILLGATPLLQGVIEEKMQRIAEVLLGSVQPFALMMGKLIGMVGVSLTLSSIYLGGAYWAVQHYGYGEYLSWDIVAWFLLYQILSVFMFGSLYAAIGAACTDMKEAQAMLTPVTLIAALPVFIWISVVKEPTSVFSTIASLFPPATPMLMLARQAIPPGIPLWQPILGVAQMVATTLLCVYAAGRIFRVGILLQGKGARFSDLIRWVIRG